MAAKLLAQTLEKFGYEPWIDRKDLPVNSRELTQRVDEEMSRKEMAIICIGLHDLKRCSAVGDFFRWEIDRARQLEKERKLSVIVVVHGTNKVEELVKEKMDLGLWGLELLEYLRKHYVIFFDVDTLDADVDKIIFCLNKSINR